MILTETLRDASGFARCWDQIRVLRQAAEADDDVLLDPVHFLTSTDKTRRSCSVACWKSDQLIGVLLATEHYWYGIRTGFAIGGDFSGRGLLICKPEDENVVLAECIKHLLAIGLHSIHLRYLPSQPIRQTIDGASVKLLDALIPGDRMDLKPNFEEFLSSIGRLTRRNVRAYSRKSESAGVEFVAAMTTSEYRKAVRQLNTETKFPAEQLRLDRDERFIELYEGERMGLRGPDGNFLACLCGFRLGSRFHLLTQLNSAHYENLSLSLVLRGYTIKHLIENGITQLQFMGGSSLGFGRFCHPENYRSIFIDKRHGVAATVKKACSVVVALLTASKRPIPGFLAVVCNGNLDSTLLGERTALKPAAMLFKQSTGGRELP